jgi:hypothetical protein
LDEDRAVSDRVVLDRLDRLGRVLHLQDVDPRLDILVGSELEHLPQFGIVAEVRAGQADGVAAQSLTANVAEAALGHADKDAVLFNVETRQELVQRQLRRRGGDDDQVERAHEILFEPGCGGDKALGTHLERVLLFGIAARKDGDFGTQSSAKQDGIVAQAAKTDDTDLGAGLDAVAYKGGEDGDTGAHPCH